MEIESNMQKTLRILTVSLAILLSLSNSQAAFAADEYDVEGRLSATSDSNGTCFGTYAGGNSFKFLVNIGSQISKVQIFLSGNAIPSGNRTIEIYSDLSNSHGALVGTLTYTTNRATSSGGIATYVAATPILVNAGNYYWLKLNAFNAGCAVNSILTFNGTAISFNLSSGQIIRRFGNTSTVDFSIYMAIFGGPSTSAPSAPTSVVATATGKRSATVSFAAPASDGGSAVTAYTATSTPGGLTQTLTQATGGTFNFNGLQPGTAYTFAVTATNAMGTSAAATSNSIKTLALDVASISSLTFADDGTGTGGKIVWSGKNIDAVLYTGPVAYLPRSI
jgi:hypothetical protein